MARVRPSRSRRAAIARRLSRRWRRTIARAGLIERSTGGARRDLEISGSALGDAAAMRGAAALVLATAPEWLSRRSVPAVAGN